MDSLSVESIRVPAATVRRAKAIAKLLVPVVLTAAATAATTTWGWIRSRTSVDEVRPLIVGATLIAKEAQSQGHTNHGEILALQALGVELAKTAIALHAQAEVDRAYSKSPRRVEYIDRAQRYYARELERQLTAHGVNTGEALRLARLAVWRPDRDDD
jgi:hypothetical protein